MEQVRHVMTDDEKVEALAELCEMVSGDERRAKAVMPVIIEVARSTAERAGAIRMLIVG